MNNENFEINRIIPFSNVDGPGNRFAVFLQECNINCLYCHNPETINICNSCGTCIPTCPTGALSWNEKVVSYNKTKCIECDTCIKNCPRSSSPKAKKISVDELLQKIRKRSDFLSGVSFSGGECSLQYLAITELFIKMKEKTPKLTRLIDTNGYIDVEPLTDFVNNADLFVLDIKVFNEADHIRLIGKSNKTILKNLQFLLGTGKLYEVRTVICPELFNCEETVSEVAKVLNGSKVNYKLTPYRPQGVREKFSDIIQPDKYFMAKLENIVKKIL